jgi:HAD superfamily phosphatase (TIGR01668 family)
VLTLLKPDLFLASVAEISLEQLKRKGIKGIIIDLDNTVTCWNQNNIRPEIKNWFVLLAEYNFRACISSNNSPERGDAVVAQLSIPSVFNAGKPRRRSFRRAMQIMETSPVETAVVGDQVFTDVLGGNRLGLYTILVAPLSKQEFIGTRFMRCIEKMVFFLIK